MEKIVAAASGYVLAFSLCAATARADETAISLSLNATNGHHIEPNRAESIPFLPLPMLELEHVHKNYRIHLEGMPPIGPVPLSQSNEFAESSAPRVSYLSGELYYAPPASPLMFGIGETVLNQQTINQVPYLQNASYVQYSRIVGLRFAARAGLYSDARNRLSANIAVSPSMHGLENGAHAEDASLVDGTLRWRVMNGDYGFSYGLRYLNYTAAYSSDHSLADRNHLLMPFVGIDWFGKRNTVSQVADPPVIPVHHSENATTFGLTLLGSNGNRTSTQAPSDTPLPFALIPLLAASKTFGRFEVQTEGILPNASSSPFNAPLNRWSYLNVDVLAAAGRGPLAFGLGESVTNLEPAKPLPHETSATRSAAVDYIARLRFARTPSSNAYVQFRMNPYVHVSTFTTYTFPNQPTRTFDSVAHGSRVDVTLGRELDVKRFVVSYGLRYINQTTNYFQQGPDIFLTRSTSLMPFVRISFRH